MPPRAKRTLTRVEREWSDFPGQPLDNLFELAGTDSAADAQAVGEGLAWTWISWYMAMAKPIRKRNVRQLLDRYMPLPGYWRSSLAQVIDADEAAAFQVLRTFMLACVRTAWKRKQRGDSASDDDPEALPPIDWDQWSGPGIG